MRFHGQFSIQARRIESSWSLRWVAKMENLWIESSYFVALTLCSLTKLDHNIGWAQPFGPSKRRRLLGDLLQATSGLGGACDAGAGLKSAPLRASGAANQWLPATLGLFSALRDMVSARNKIIPVYQSVSFETRIPGASQLRLEIFAANGLGFSDALLGECSFDLEDSCLKAFKRCAGSLFGAEMEGAARRFIALMARAQVPGEHQ